MVGAANVEYLYKVLLESCRPAASTCGMYLLLLPIAMEMSG